MWKSTGRSGYGDQAILGDYDDWQGLSMNGQQWKNPQTKETRDLSGADYWHLRKAIEPKQPEDIPTFVNGKPNIAAFAEPKTSNKKPVSNVKSWSKIDLANTHYERLCKQHNELEDAFSNGEIEPEQYRLLRYKLDIRMAKAWQRIEKENQPFWEEEDARLEAEQQAAIEEEKEINLKNCLYKGSGVVYDTFNSLRDDNIFKRAYMFSIKLRGVFK